MDSTPDKNTHPSPSFLNNFEDSPVFNYISTLSPIRQFRLGHSAESINLLSFPSPQSLQTPQSTGCAKEPTHTRASNVTEVSINNCSQNGSEGRTVGTSDAVQPADLHIDEVEKLDSGEEMTVCATEESPKPVTEHPKPLKHECVNPENHVVHCGAVKQECDNDVGGIGILFPAKVIQDVSKEAEGSFETEIGFQGIQVDDNKDVSEWENFMHEASDILNCHSPTEENNCEELDDKTEDSESFITAALQPPTENFDETQKVESVCPIVSTENHRGTGQPDEKNQVPAGNARALLSEEVVSYIRTETNEKSSSLQQQTTSRRCLVYEMSGTHYRKLLSDPDSGTPIFNPAVCPDTAKENCLAANRPGNNRCSSLLPGIGLHLNALAAASRDKIIVKRQTLTCRRQLISLPSTISSFDSSTPDTKPPTTSLVPELTEKDCVQRNMSCFNSLASDTKAHNVPVAPMFVEGGCDEQKDGAQVTGNACENFTFDESVEILQSSPKKKRKRSDNVGEAGSCKRCNCKRSKCLKLYCECFAAGLYCVEPCNCQDCFNKPAHEETVLETRRQIESRNPLAFAPKVIRCSGSPNHGDELNKTPSSARHKRGCNCKKSGCLKKYCECFQGGVGCSLSCRCEGCKNTFGQKEGTLFEEAKILRMCAVDAVSQSDDDNQATEPCNITRQPVRRPFHFGSIAQQFSSSSGEPYLQSCTTEKTENLDQTAYEEDLKIAPDDEAPEISQGDYLLPTTCVKSTSPNCKRISPALRDFETSPGWKSCRKLILRSISAFPTVTQDNESTELQEKLQ